MAISNSAGALLLLLPAVAVAVLLLGKAAHSSADFPLGGQATVRLPPAAVHQPRFAARVVVLDAHHGRRQPGFVAAVNAEAADGAAGAYACSLVLLLGGVKVWASDHLEKFAARDLCRLELTEDGQLRLTDGTGKVGWLSGTAGQGVKALHLDGKTGNLVLVDGQNVTRWQSLDDPTDKFLRGQHRSLPAYFITSSTTDETSSPFYSLELDGDKVAAYSHVGGDTSYSYWELAAPVSANRTMASARLDGSGLKMLDAEGVTAAQISPPIKKPPLSFMALAGDGNLEMFYYDAWHRRFSVSYKALGLCELPLSCGVRQVCSGAGTCKDFAAYADSPARAGGAECMVHLKGVTTVLRPAAASAPLAAGVTLRQCVARCASNISCSAALYVKDAGASAADDAHGVCEHYTLAAGAREVTDDGSRRRYSYWVKLPAAAGGGGGDEDVVDDDGGDSSGLLGKILMVCGAVDVVGAVVFAVLIVFYFQRLRRLAAPVDRAVELQQGEAEGAGEQNSPDNDGADGVMAEHN
ncbi:unnamed protein product [Urochloa decumbens]|uniref:non-specific serine/threonine protein kinase n=1 Tax=Urochloa decumbens TaxID=240449 RepID=A0ABC8YPP5_9POAL